MKKIFFITFVSLLLLCSCKKQSTPNATTKASSVASSTTTTSETTTTVIRTSTTRPHVTTTTVKVTTTTSTTSTTTTTTTTIDVADKYSPFREKDCWNHKAEFNYDNYSSRAYDGQITFYSYIYESTLKQNGKPIFIMITEDPLKKQSYLLYNTNKELFIEQTQQIYLSVYACHGKELYGIVNDYIQKMSAGTDFDTKKYGPYITKRGEFTQFRQKGFKSLY